MTLLTSVGDALTEIIGWAGEVLTSVVAESGALHDLMPLWAVGIAVSGVMLGIRIMRGFAWGN